MKNPIPIILMLKKLMEKSMVVSTLIEGIYKNHSHAREKIKLMERLGLIKKGRFTHAQKYKITEMGIKFYGKYRAIPKKLGKCLKELDY